MRRKTRDFIGVTILAGYIALSVRIALAFWDPGKPDPERAMVVIFAWCFANMAVFFAVAFVWNRLSPPRGGSSTGPSAVPPEPSPAGLPLRPRHPAPLIAHAEPPTDCDA